MVKKGNISFEEILKWILGFLVIFVIISIVIGPDKLFAATRDSIFSFGSGLIPEKKQPPTATKERIPIEELEKYFDNLAFKIKNSGSGEQCRINIGEIPKIKGFSIVLDKNKIQIEKIDRRGRTPPEKIENIEGFKPCSVKGVKTTQFYRCLKYAQPYQYAPDWCKSAYEEENSIILDGNAKIAKFLFKFDNEHSCIIYLDGTDLSPGCTELKGSIDDACVDEITRVYSDCSNPAPPKTQFDKECDAIEYCYAKLQITNAYPPNSGCDPKRPKAFFHSKEDCIKGYQCINEHTNKMTMQDCDDLNKQISLSGRDVWVWPKY